MKTLAVFALAAIAVFVFVSATAYAEPKFVVLTGEEWTTGLLPGGEVRCLGGEPTGDFPQLCTEGTKRIFVRGLTETSLVVATTGDRPELMTGGNVIIANCNLDSSYAGNCWGTFTITLDDEVGVWEGSWNGQFDFLEGTSSYSAVGNGTSGDVEGMHTKYDAAASGEGYAAFTVRINTK